MSKVKNINGTTGLNCKCGSWLKHWEIFSGRTAKFCSIYGCSKEKDLKGAHVQKDIMYDYDWYIIPLCSEHNQAGGTLDVSPSTIFVSANVSKTCGKSH